MRANKTNFQMKGFALGLALKQRRNHLLSASKGAILKVENHDNEAVKVFDCAEKQGNKQTQITSAQGLQMGKESHYHETDLLTVTLYFQFGLGLHKVCKTYKQS